MNPITVFLTLVAVLIGLALLAAGMPIAAAAFFVLAVLVFTSLKMANAWERFVILRAGRLHGVKGPGLVFIVPILDSITAIVDQRIQTTAFSAEQALTRDTVPVNVEAVVF
jgi:regulator of protease activity HflC (stomatin/prohibitin superfamily)